MVLRKDLVIRRFCQYSSCDMLTKVDQVCNNMLKQRDYRRRSGIEMVESICREVQQGTGLKTKEHLRTETPNRVLLESIAETDITELNVSNSQQQDAHAKLFHQRVQVQHSF